MSFEELRKELEKVASLKVMEEAVGKPKVTKITATAASGQQGQAGGGGGTRQRRFLPEGFNPSMFGCLRCGERTEPPHEARNCTLEKKNLECTYCGIKGSHLEAVCFKKLEAEGKLVPKQPETRSQSPAGGRSQTPGPGPRLNKIVEVGGSRRDSCSHTRSTTATRGAFQSPGGQGEVSSNSPTFAPANSLPAGQTRGKQPRVCTLRTAEDGGGRWRCGAQGGAV